MLELGIKLVTGVVLVLFGSLVLREIVERVFRLEDDTLSTATSVVLWTMIVMLLFSFLPLSNYILMWGLTLVVNITFVLLVKRYYKIPWKTTFGVWGAWFAAYLIFAFVLALVVSTATY